MEDSRIKNERMGGGEIRRKELVTKPKHKWNWLWKLASLPFGQDPNPRLGLYSRACL